MYGLYVDHGFMRENETNSVVEQLKKSGFNNLNTIYIDIKNEASQIVDICESKKIDLIILDKLHYEDDYIKSIKILTDKKVVSFHEYQDYSKYSDLKINYNLFNGFEINTDTSLLSGPKYIIFDDGVEKNDKIKEQFVFVSFGGSDPSDILTSFVNN